MTIHCQNISRIIPKDADFSVIQIELPAPALIFVFHHGEEGQLHAECVGVCQSQGLPGLASEGKWHYYLPGKVSGSGVPSFPAVANCSSPPCRSPSCCLNRNSPYISTVLAKRKNSRLTTSGCNFWPYSLFQGQHKGRCASRELIWAHCINSGIIISSHCVFSDRGLVPVRGEQEEVR